MNNFIPQPMSVVPSDETYTLTPEAVIATTPASDVVFKVGQYLAERLRRSTGYQLPVHAAGGILPRGSLYLTISRLNSTFGAEGYELRVEPDRMTLTAFQPTGLFRGIQTIRQLFPPPIEKNTRQPGPWRAGTVLIRDNPRFGWRGTMLDVARHFFSAEDIKRFIDQLAYYKMNVLHLHLTDDQGWRLMINSWPNLARIGGSTAIHGDQGGFYTQDEFRAIVSYAGERYITIIPELDVPGHTNAALASYPELNSSGNAPKPYTGTQVGFSSLVITKDITYKFLEDVIREVAALTPGPYIHVGGDEAHSTPDADYRQFVERIQKIVQAHGKVCVGWEEVARGNLSPQTIVQYWVNGEWALKAGQRGNKLIMSPSTKSYLDIKYNAGTPLGQDWTGNYIDVQDAYEWDPGSFLKDLPKEAVLGLEAPMWTETTATTGDLDFMIFPRLPGYAEIGWTPLEKRNWPDYRLRLANHGARLAAMGVNFYRSPQVAWEKAGLS